MATSFRFLPVKVLPELSVALLLAASPAFAQQATEQSAAEAATASAPGAGTAESPPQSSGTSATATKKITEPPALILQPYQVQLLISFPADPRFSATWKSELTSGVERELHSRFRQMWLLEVQSAGDTRRYEADQVRLATADELNREFLPTGRDKVFLVALNRRGATYRVVIREWDANSQTAGPVLTTETNDPRTLIATMADGVANAFRPLAAGEVLEEGKIDFQVRGGELFPADESVRQFQPGDYLVPYIRYLNRNREVRQIQMFPWTYFQVETVDRSRIRLNYISTFRYPFSAARRRVEVMAMRVRPQFSQTELRIYPRNNPLNPLVGYRCEVLDRLPTDEDPVEDRLKLITDRWGKVVIPASPDSPLRYLMVYSGQALLARVPIVPGIEPQLELETPDDRARLRVEGEVALLQGELIDIVGTREVIMARIRGAAEKKDWQKVDLLMKDLEGLPTREQFISQIQTLQVQAVYRAQQLKDRVQEIRAKRLCTEITESATRYLDPVRIIEFRQSIREDRGSG